MQASWQLIKLSPNSEGVLHGAAVFAMWKQKVWSSWQSPILSDQLLLDIPHVEGILFNIKLVI